MALIDTIKSGLYHGAEIAMVGGIGCFLARVVNDASKSLKFNLPGVAACCALFSLTDQVAQSIIKRIFNAAHLPSRPGISTLRLIGSAAAVAYGSNLLAPRIGLPSTPLAPLIALILAANVVYRLFYIAEVALRAGEKELITELEEI